MLMSTITNHTLRERYVKRVAKLIHKTAENVIAIGDILIEAREGPDRLPHGEFEAMIKEDLGFSPATARKFMAIARYEPIRSHENVLPADWNIIYRLTLLEPATFIRNIQTGVIHRAMARADVQALLPPREAKPEAAAPKPKSSEQQSNGADPSPAPPLEGEILPPPPATPPPQTVTQIIADRAAQDPALPALAIPVGYLINIFLCHAISLF
jgi:hypothetical protein